MGVDELLDAAMVGFDRGETLTIPPLAEETLWTKYKQTRSAPALSPHQSPASR